MRFPDWYLKQLRERVSIADYAGKRLTWDRKKSRPSAGDYWAPCPFHSEKSASFHVRDREGVFKCFGCGEGGDVFTLCQKIEGLDFNESVQRLGAEAGFLPPEETAGAKRENDRRGRLLAALTKAQAFFRKSLLAPEGRAARAYLEGRGLPPEVWERFGIGLAPDGWTALADALTKDGFTRAELAAAGLAKEGGRSGVIDVFRNRIMFPIADPQGRVIAFGGRALAKDEAAKYLNSPETEVFHKGSTLYRLKEARERLAKTKGAETGGGLVLAEGYLDVVAFERAGFPAVAPLGTALTADQLALLWKAGATPTLCFDGDAAGQRAARKALDLALPDIGPQQTLRIAVLPGKLDPDDLYKSGGAAALAEALNAAIPADEALFAFERDARPLQTPEQRADLKSRIAAAAGKIKHEETRRQYLRALNDRAYKLFAPAPRAPFVERGKSGARNGPLPGATPELKALSSLHRAEAVEFMVRLPTQLPQVLERGADLFAAFPIEDRDLDTIRHAILDLWSSMKKVDREALSHHLLAAGQENAHARLLLWPSSSAKAVDGREPGGRATGAPSANKAESARGPVSRSSIGALTAEAAEEIEAEWMAFLTLDVTGPQVREEVLAARERDLDSDDAAFAAAEAALRARRAMEEAALRRGVDTAPSDPAV